ncbi:MAG: hypothetical protein GXP22_04335 [Gammaproteobacteria bacterium]|nr:hypothetical protein [Gammaproteobacteria bacterium]
MMINIGRLIVFSAIVSGIGCSSGEDKVAPEKTVSEPVFQGQIQALEKAKELELMIKNEAEKRRQAIKEGSN